MFLLAAVGSTSTAAAENAVKPPASENVEQNSYVGNGTRLGLGYDSKTKLRGEFFQVIQEDANTALIGEGWLSGSAGGLKLNYHWLPKAALPSEGVRKAFLAVDRNITHDSKITLGGGIEKENWFWGGSLSHSLSGRRELGLTTDATVETISGVEGDRTYLQDITTTTTTRTYERPYDFGVGLIAGHYFEPALLRLYARLDQEWGSSASRQTTFGIGAEKFFVNSPISLALNADTYRKTGDFETQQNDSRINFMFRYEFGGKSFRPARESKLVEVQIPVKTPVAPEPESAPAIIEVPVVEAPANKAEVSKTQEKSQKAEMRLVKTTASMSADAFFKLDKSTLTPVAREELDNVITQLNAGGYTGNILLTGHTCDLASDSYNLKLSLRRAKSVKKYLVDHGIPADTLIVEGRGESEPRYPNTKEMRHKNRRVEMAFVTYVENTEKVLVPVEPAPIAKTTPAAPPADKPIAAKPAPATTPAVEWKREYIESEPSWVRRALHNTVPHKQAVDVYREQEKTSAVTTGERRYTNKAPIAVNDSFAISGNSSNNLLNVLINDSDPDGDTLRIVSVQSPAHGTATVSGLRVSYTPTPGYIGGDQFTYTISDEKGLTSTATVTITSNVANIAPIAIDDDAWVIWGRPVTIAVLNNDSDPDGDKLTITATGPVAHGTAVIVDGKTIRYTSNSDFFGQEDFSYTISDGRGGSATAMVHVTVVDP
ncbi:MAG: Ig-like domain-containing protein [Pseudomonadota bacterium]